MLHLRLRSGYAPVMDSQQSDWIAPAGLFAVDADYSATTIPSSVLGDADLSLIAKGIYVLACSYHSRPINPYEDAIEDPADISAAIEELIATGLIVRIER